MANWLRSSRRHASRHRPRDVRVGRSNTACVDGLPVATPGDAIVVAMGPYCT